MVVWRGNKWGGGGGGGGWFWVLSYIASMLCTCIIRTHSHTHSLADKDRFESRAHLIFRISILLIL